VTTLRFDKGLCFETKVRILLSLEQSPSEGMTSYFLPEINAVSTALQNTTFQLHFHIPSVVLFCCYRFENYRPWKPRQ
jgi:hypothetical protein